MPITKKQLAAELQISTVSLWRYEKDPSWPASGTRAEQLAWIRTHRGLGGKRAAPGKPPPGPKGDDWDERWRRARALKTEQQIEAEREKEFRERHIPRLRTEMVHFLGDFRQCLHTLGLTATQTRRLNAEISKAMARLEAAIKQGLPPCT